MNHSMLTQPIHYIVLLGPRDEPQFTNVPQPSVCSPMLRFLGYFPQSMYHFIYGVEYFEQVKRYGLQMGYDVKFIYSDCPQDSIERLDWGDGAPTILLVCTDDADAIDAYNTLFDGNVNDSTLCFSSVEVKDKLNLQCAKATGANQVWQWLYDFAETHCDIDRERLPFCVPVIPADVYDSGNVFTPSRVNTQTINAILGNWDYAEDLTERDLTELQSQSSWEALSDKDGFGRQDLLVGQIAKIRKLESMVMVRCDNHFCLEDQFRSPLIISLPYTSIEMRKIQGKESMAGEDRGKARLAEKILSYHYTRNYTVWNHSEKMTEDQFFAFSQLQRDFLVPRMLNHDFCASLHASMRFSPYLRLPIMGKNINSELTFVSIKNVDKIVKAKNKRESIRKAMEKVGKKIAEETLAPSAVEMLVNDASQIVAMTDLPVEWMMVDGVPLGFSHDVCRIPETPPTGMLAQYVEARYVPYVIPKDIMQRTLVIYGNEEEAFVEAQQPVNELSAKLGFRIRKCLCKDDFFRTVKEVNPEFLIIDCHGGVDENTHQSFLMMGDDSVSGEDIIANDIHPRLVFLSACKTFTTCNTVSTIANAFFQTGAASVITSYMSLEVMPSTMLYCRLLNNLNHAARNPVHFNWLSFMSHLLRTSYIDAPLEHALNKKGMPSKEQLVELAKIQTESMCFSKRREIYSNLNTNSFTKSLGVDYKYVIPHYLMYSILGRADLVRFEVGMEEACGVSIKDIVEKS